MILYVDETENNEYFILTGLLLESDKIARDIYYSFKKKANRYKIPENLKAKLYTEFKSTLMDEKFPKLKKSLINEIKSVDTVIIYSTYVKKSKRLKSDLKLSLYIKMINKIIESIGYDIDIVFDKCSNSTIDNSIIKAVSTLSFVKSLKACDSQLTPGLQLVDNMCSIIRRKYSNSDINNHFELIVDNIKEAI